MRRTQQHTAARPGSSKKGLLVALLTACAVFSSVAKADVINYGNITYTGANSKAFTDNFDLTTGDLTLSYTIDLRSVPAGWGQNNWFQVGLNNQAPNFNPGYGNGGWMTSHVNDFTFNPNLQHANDMHGLQSGPGGPELYNATTPNAIGSAFGTAANYGIFFDRDGVSASQQSLWGMSDGVTYNTGGIYDIEIVYHAIDATKGTMFATVNGVEQGFYTSGWQNAAPDIWPAGLGFEADMTKLRVFVGMWKAGGDAGSITVSNLQVAQVPEPASLLLFTTGLGIMVWVRRRVRQ